MVLNAKKKLTLKKNLIYAYELSEILYGKKCCFDDIFSLSYYYFLYYRCYVLLLLEKIMMMVLIMVMMVFHNRPKNTYFRDIN